MDRIPRALFQTKGRCSHPNPGSKRGEKSILVVDDNLVFQKAMLMKLRGYGYDVMTAEDGSSALAAIKRLKPDLILMDH